MGTNTTTTTTTTPSGETTIQKVESEWSDEVSKIHTTLSNWLTHLKSLATIGTLSTAAYALWTFAKHLV